MWAIFKRDLFKNWLMILGWGLGFGLLAYFLFDIYEAMFLQNVDLVNLLEAFPEGMMAFFGGEDIDIFEPAGFVHLEFFSYIHIILGIMIINSATGLLVKKEEEGTLELIISQPISRTGLFLSRLLALLVSLVLIFVLIWAGFTLGLENVDTFNLEHSQLVLPLVSLMAVLLVFLGLGLLLSLILSSSSAANLVSGFILIASYFITSLSQIDDRLETLNQFSPLRFYQGGSALNGLNLEHALILFGLAAAFIAIAWFLFEKRDFRFGSTGGFRIKIPLKSKKDG